MSVVYLCRVGLSEVVMEVVKSLFVVGWVGVGRAMGVWLMLFGVGASRNEGW